MSNKTLAISIIIILLLFAGVFFLVRMRNQKSLDDQYKSQTENSGQQQNQPADQTSQDQQQPETASTTPTSTPISMTDCKRDFDANKLKTAKVTISNREVTMNVKDFGVIKLSFYDKDAPKAVENFLRLVNAGYYDCLTFHRVAKGFVIQGGDPNGDGSGGESAFGAKFNDELDPNTPSSKAGYLKGVLAMANSGPNTNGSQFFIMLGDNDLPHLYTIFGKVTSGLDVVDKIGAVDITPQLGPTDGAPKVPVVMSSVKISK